MKQKALITCQLIILKKKKKECVNRPLLKVLLLVNIKERNPETEEALEAKAAGSVATPTLRVIRS